MKFANKFFQRAFEPRNDIALYLASNAIVWIAFLLLGAIPLTLVYVLRAMTDNSVAYNIAQNPSDLSGLRLGEIPLFVLVMLQFVIGFLAVYFVVRVLLKRPFVSIISGYAKFRWRRFFEGFGVWLALMALYSVIMWLVKPEEYVMNFNPGKFFLFLPFALILVPIQSSFEELAFRGLLMQSTLRMAPRFPWASIALQAVLFGLIHTMNPEVTKYGFFLMMGHYISFGLILGIFTTMDEGAEVAMGMHSGNNLFAFVFLSYEGIALPSPSIFQQKVTHPEFEFLAVLVMAVFAFMILMRNRLPNLAELTRGGTEA